MRYFVEAARFFLTWLPVWLMLGFGTAVAAAPPILAHPPRFYAIVVGVSDYAGDDLRLRFAARDAESMAATLNLAAARMFGEQNVQVTLLATGREATLPLPTKKLVKEAFFQVAERARPADVLVVYFAGHGISLPQGSYCFLTCEARTAVDVLDVGLRNITAVTGEELQRWLAEIQARKQVLILDTCSAGALPGSLLDKRDISGDYARAMSRLQEREGLFFLMGCAADTISYESNQYGQGLLTYSLLQGMKGAALRDDEFVDVSTLFNYAADQVPVLAQHIGGIQRPIIAIPRGTSFDIGALTFEDRARVPLFSKKPLVVRPMLLDRERIGDPLHLGEGLLTRLRKENDALAQQTSGKIVFIDSEEFPGSFKPKGLYSVEGEELQLTLKLWQDNRETCTLTLNGRTDALPALYDELIAAITAALAP